MKRKYFTALLLSPLIVAVGGKANNSALSDGSTSDEVAAGYFVNRTALSELLSGAHSRTIIPVDSTDLVGKPKDFRLVRKAPPDFAEGGRQFRLWQRTQLRPMFGLSESGTGLIGLNDWDAIGTAVDLKTRLTESQANLAPWANSIGKISCGGKIFGSGFLISKNKVVTARHVISDIEKAFHGSKTITFLTAYGQNQVIKITDNSAVIDAAIIANDAIVIKLSTPITNPVPLIDLDVNYKPEDNDPILSIGHPVPNSEGDQGNFYRPRFSELFGGKVGNVYFSPGVIRSAGPVNNDSWAHDCSSFSGFSGGPVISLKTNKIIGIHTGYDKVIAKDQNRGVMLNLFTPLSATRLAEVL